MAPDTDPYMHTAEHVLNQTMVRLFGTDRCFSAHLNRKKSKCDYHFHRNLTDEELARLAEAVNDALGRDLDVTEEFMPRADAETAFNLDRLPDSAGDELRIVRVGDYDACPCIGPHAENTREVGRFRIVSASHEDGVLRVRFKIKRPG